jgi:predicted DNA-binding transcriptional regulator YafY
MRHKVRQSPQGKAHTLYRDIAHLCAIGIPGFENDMHGVSSLG